MLPLSVFTKYGGSYAKKESGHVDYTRTLVA
jgi:hypothetical protein